MAWCQQLATLEESMIREVVALVPAQRMPDAAKQFVVRMLNFNREQLEDLCQTL